MPRQPVPTQEALPLRLAGCVSRPKAAPRRHWRPLMLQVLMSQWVAAKLPPALPVRSRRLPEGLPMKGPPLREKWPQARRKAQESTGMGDYLARPTARRRRESPGRAASRAQAAGTCWPCGETIPGLRRGPQCRPPPQAQPTLTKSCETWQVPGAERELSLPVYRPGKPCRFNRLFRLWWFEKMVKAEGLGKSGCLAGKLKPSLPTARTFYFFLFLSLLPGFLLGEVLPWGLARAARSTASAWAIAARAAATARSASWSDWPASALS